MICFPLLTGVLRDISYDQTFYFLFIIIYSAVNSYIVNKLHKCMEAQPPEIEQHKTETKGLKQ